MTPPEIEAALDVLAAGIQDRLKQIDRERGELAVMHESIEQLRTRIRVTELHGELFAFGERRFDHDLISNGRTR